MKNEKNQDKLQDALGKIDEKLIARAAKQPMKYATKIKWISSVAAVLVVCIVFGALMGSGVLSAPQNNGGAHPLFPSAQLAVAMYPQMTQYPGDENYNSDEYRQWSEDCLERQSYFGCGEDLHTFFERTVTEFLSSDGTENLVYSPLSTYMALAMIAETASGNTQKQILDLIGVDSIEVLREQAHAVWNANYRDDGLVTSLIANSVWLNSERDFHQETLNALAEYYYTSTYNGEMGDEAYIQAMRDWMNAQTRDALKDQVNSLKIPSDTVMALISTIYFCAKWEFGFSEKNNTQSVFHGASGDEACVFMNQFDDGAYYWGEHFSAVEKRLMGNASMYFILPEEGMMPKELLGDDEVRSFLFARDWKNKSYPLIDLSVPKFNVSNEVDLKKGLENLGVTDCFDSTKADFSPLMDEDADLFIGKMNHGASFEIDEEGVVGAAMTMVLYFDTAAPLDRIEFTLDRPFLFVVQSDDGMPLFVGTVNQIK